MQAHFVTIVGIVAKLYQILPAQHSPTLTDSFGGSVPFEAVVHDESATNAFLFDVAATFRNQSCENGMVVGL